VLFSEPKISQSSGSPTSRAATREFQCSSASRKFLNQRAVPHPHACAHVSVLFSEPKISQSCCDSAEQTEAAVSVLFSEPKISQLNVEQQIDQRFHVSVLFSEPKISQSTRRRYFHLLAVSVSVLFSEPKISQSGRATSCATTRRFQCSSASRKFLNVDQPPVARQPAAVSVLFSEPKISQSWIGAT